MNTDESYAPEMPASAPASPPSDSPRRSGLLGWIVVLCVCLAIGWFFTHRKTQLVVPQTAATQALNMCEQAVQRAASHPASVDFSQFGTQPPTKLQGGGYMARLAYEEKDSRGDSIAEEAICTVKGGKLVSFKEPKP